jgi:hypothetical protein
MERNWGSRNLCICGHSWSANRAEVGFPHRGETSRHDTPCWQPACPGSSANGRQAGAGRQAGRHVVGAAPRNFTFPASVFVHQLSHHLLLSWGFRPVKCSVTKRVWLRYNMFTLLSRFALISLKITGLINSVNRKEF